MTVLPDTVLPDVVYVVKIGTTNEQLRYSLRSLKNIPHRRVFIAGYVPPWVTGVVPVPVEQTGQKHANALHNLKVALEHPELGESFLYMNDDFFTMRPIPEVPPLHRGPVAAVEEKFAAAGFGLYLAGLKQAKLVLATLGYTDPLCYELHVPFPAQKSLYREVLELTGDQPHLHHRTVYGNLHHRRAGRMSDVKVYRRDDGFREQGVFLSTMSDSFTHGRVGAFIRSRFPEPGKYENPAVAAGRVAR